MKKRKNRLPLFLTLGSLLLLLIFQGVWLQSCYQQEEEDLRERADEVFLDAVRGIEDAILRDMVMDPVDFFCDDSTSISDLTVAFGLNMDSVQNFIASAEDFSKRIALQNEGPLDPSDFHIRTDRRKNKKDRTFGSLTFFMAMTDDSDYYEPFLENCEENDQTLLLLDNELQKTLPSADLPIGHKLALLHDGEARQPGFYSTTQTDILRGGSYALFFPEYQLYLLQRILPQILFSALLFSVILLSFYVIWQSLEKQRRLTDLKNDFISNVTHELKTPITTVGVAIEAMSSFNAMDNPARTKEYLEISKHELDRLTILVDKVLKMSLFEKQAPELKIEYLDLKILTQEILESMKLQFEKFTAKVDLKALGNSFQLEGDRIHLTSVIYNLIDNALKYSPGHPHIELCLKEEPNQICFEVKDKGIGIPKVYLDKIFDQFFRVPNGDQHDIKGHGLGLSYVAGVIQKHRGDIEVDSILNQGTQFTIRIPKKYA